MNSKIKRALAVLLVMILTVSSVPMQGIAAIDFSAVAENVSEAVNGLFQRETYKLSDMKTVGFNINSQQFDGVSLYTENVRLAIGDSETFFVNIEDEDGNPVENFMGLSWSASPASAVELHVQEDDTRYCTVTVKQTDAKQITIYASAYGQTLSHIIEVIGNGLNFGSDTYYILVDSDKLVLSFAMETTLDPKAVWTTSTDIKSLEDSDYEFTSSDPSVLSVTGKNWSYYSGGANQKRWALYPRVHGVKEGEVTLTVTAGEDSDTCTVHVVPLKEYKIEAYSEDLETPLADAAITYEYNDGSLTTNAEKTVKTDSSGICTILAPDTSVAPPYPIKGIADFHPELTLDSKQLVYGQINRFNLKSNVTIPGVKTSSSNVSALSTEVGDDIMANLIDFDVKFELFDKVEIKFYVDMTEKKLKGTVKVSLDKTESKVEKGDGRTKEVREEHENFKTLFNGFNKDWVDKQWKNLRGQTKTGKAKFGIDADLAVAGFIEFDFSQGKMVFSEGGLVVSAELSVEKTIYTSVPAVFVAFKLEGSAEAGFKLSQKAAVGVYNGIDVSVTVEFGIGASIALGVGCDRIKADVGVEGKLTFGVTIPVGQKTSLRDMLKITAEISGFFEWKVDLWLFKFGNKYTLAKVTAELYPELSASFDWIGSKSLNEFELMPRGYLSESSLKSKSYFGEISLSNVYPNGDPQIVSLSDNSKIAVWLEDNGTKSSINRTTLVYSIFKNGQWSSENPVCETGRYDGTPKLVSDGTTAHLLWLRGAKVFNDNDSFNEFSKNTELVYSKFSNSTWSSPTTIKSNNGKYPLYYSIAANNGNATVSWTENSENNVFLTSGTTTIYQKDLSNNSWLATKSVTQTANPINSIVSGYIANQPKVAYSVDTDGDMTTTGDKRIFIDGNAVTPDDEVDYTGLLYENGKFYFSGDSSLCWYNGATFAKTDLKLSSGYQIAKYNNQIAVVMVQQSGYKSELMVSYSTDDNSFTNPVYLTDYDQNVSAFDVVMNTDGSLTYCMDLRYVENNEFGQTDFVIDTFANSTEVSMTDAVYDMLLSEDVKNTIFACTISNDGTTTVNGFNLKLVDKNNRVLASTYYSEPVVSGEKVEAQVSYDIPTNYDGSDFRLIVTPEKDTDWTNNEYVFNFGYADLVVENGTISSSGKITATIRNKGYNNAYGVKAIISTFDGEDVKLSEIAVGNIARGASSNITYQVASDLLVSDSYIHYPSFKVEVSSNDPDLNYANDNQSVLFAPTRVTGVSVASKTKVLAVGDTSTIAYDIMPSTATDKHVYWFVEDENVATIDAEGNITGVSLGTTTVKIVSADGRFEDACQVTVSSTVPATGITVSPTSASILVGETRQLTAEVLPDNATNKTVTWSTNKSSVATVSNSGLVTAKSAGTATISARTSDGKYRATCIVTVVTSAIPVTGVTISPTTLSLNVNDESQLTATVSPSNATNQNLTWSSSNSSVATVNNSGYVKAIKAGSATITVTTQDGNYKAQCSVTVKAANVPITGVSVSPKTLSMKIGDTATLKPTITPSNATNKSISWSSSDSSVASVKNGIVTANKIGSATITVKTIDGSFNDTCLVTVTKPAGHGKIVSVELNTMPNTTEYKYKYDGAVNLTGLSLKVTYADGATEIITDTSKMSVSRLDAGSTGDKTLTVTYEGYSVSFDVKVKYTFLQWIIMILLLGWLWYK